MTPVRHYQQLDGTNAEAMRLALTGEAGPLWIVADAQTGGRGRSGRQWLSAPGNLFASHLFTTRAALTDVHQLSLVAGVAVFDAIQATGIARHPDVRLKWPNDILLHNATAGGILVESTALPGRAGLAAIVGIGLNLASHPSIADRPATHLAAWGTAPDAKTMLAGLDAALVHALSLWNAGRGFAQIRQQWLARSGAIGEAITVNGGQERIAGSYAGLDSDGALLMDLPAGERRRCTYGDVTLG